MGKEKETCAAQLVQGRDEAEALQQENDDMLKMVGRADRAADERIKAHVGEFKERLEVQERETAAATKADPAHAPLMAPHIPALPNGTAVADHSACRQEQGQLKLEEEEYERATLEAKLHAAQQEVAELKAGGAPQGAAAPAGSEPGQDSSEVAQSILRVINMANSNPAVKQDLLQALGGPQRVGPGGVLCVHNIQCTVHRLIRCQHRYRRHVTVMALYHLCVHVALLACSVVSRVGESRSRTQRPGPTGPTFEYV